MVEICIFIVTWHKIAKTYLLSHSVQELKLTQHASKHRDSWWFHCTRTEDSATNEELTSQDILFLSPKSKAVVVIVVQNMEVDPHVFHKSSTRVVYLILDRVIREEIYEVRIIFLWQHFSDSFLVFLSSLSSVQTAILGGLRDELDRGVFLQWKRWETPWLIFTPRWQ